MGRVDKVADRQPYYKLDEFTVDSYSPCAYSWQSGLTVENIHGRLQTLGSLISGGYEIVCPQRRSARHV
jgi:hypothetical protein